MALLLIVLSLACLFIIAVGRAKSNIAEAIPGSLILMSILVVISAELLSVFNFFNFFHLVIFWLIVLFFAALIILRNKYYLRCNFKKTVEQISKNKILFFFISGLLLLLLLQGLFYPPNSWDSMTYHMGRILHWINNNNINHFPTHIYRQIYQPPFSELFIAEICMLTKSDLFANAVQWLFLAGSLPVIVLICREFNFKKKSTCLSLIFICTTPEILTEASSTQNDIVVSFFILSAILFCIRSYKTNSMTDIFLLSLGAGLACLTKGTAYIYLLPLFILWALCYIIKPGNKIPFRILVIPLLFITINSGYYYRNYKLTGSIFGKPEEYYLNEEFGFKKSFLGLAKNTGLHLGIFPFSELTNKAIYKLHHLLGEQVDNPRNNWSGTYFKLDKWNHHEDKSSNFFQLLLIAATVLMVLLKFKQDQKLIYFLLCFPLIEFILFSLLFKWQPWHSRLHTPVFFMFAVPVGYFFGEKILLKDFVSRSALLIITFYALIIIVCNPSRLLLPSYITHRIGVNDNRYTKYFTNKPYALDDYKQLRIFLNNNHGKTGMIIGGDTWEYPLYDQVYLTNAPIAPHLDVTNISKNAGWNEKTDESKIKFIISESKSDTLVFNHKIFEKKQILEYFSIYEVKEK